MLTQAINMESNKNLSIIFKISLIDSINPLYAVIIKVKNLPERKIQFTYQSV